MQEALHGEPVLPEGSTALPMWSTDSDTPAPAPEIPAHEIQLDPVLQQMPVEFLSQLALLPKDQQDIVKQWFPYVYKQNSPYLDGDQVRWPSQVLRHAQGVWKEQERELRKKDLETKVQQREKRQQRKEERELKRERWNEYVRQCQERREHIERCKEELTKRINERDAALENIRSQLRELERQWEEYIRPAREAYKEARETPAPQRP